MKQLVHRGRKIENVRRKEEKERIKKEQRERKRKVIYDKMMRGGVKICADWGKLNMEY